MSVTNLQRYNVLEWLINGINPMVFGFNEIMEENNNGFPPLNDNEWDIFWSNWTLRDIPIINWSTYTFYMHILN